jgi:chloramphenicol-sensitive protein RarD
MPPSMPLPSISVYVVDRDRVGVLYGAAAFGLWGLFPMYWPLLEPAGAVEILAHRMVWSLVVVGVILVVRRRLSSIFRLGSQRYWLLVVAAVLVTVNWGVYIYGVNSGNVVETSLGYFINPLFTVLLAVVILRERLRVLQWVAVAIGVAAVTILAVDYGRLPWIALTLAISFGMYGFIKKKAGVGAAEGLAIETAVMFPPAAGYLIWLQVAGTASFGHVGLVKNLLFIGAGVVTAIPLMLFGAAATRVPLATIGLLQYLAPVLQFLIGVFVMHEAMPPARIVGFAIVWVALAVFTYDSIRAYRHQVQLAVQDTRLSMSK